MNRWALAAAVAIAGLAIGLVVALASPHDHEAESVVRFSGAGVDALLPDLRALATSSVLAGNVTSTLRLSESADTIQKRLSASVRRGTRLVVINARGSSTDKARQLAQEAAVVLTQIAPRRFSSVRAEVFDPGHGVGGGDRHWFRDLGLGLLGGLVVGLFLAALLADGGAGATPARANDREREQLLARRTELVGRREAAVAKRVGELAARERELDARARELEERRRQSELPAAALSPVPSDEAVATPAVSAPESFAPELPRAGGWTLEAFEQVAEARAVARPEKADEFRAYVFFLRDYAGPDGRIPPAFDNLIEEVLSAG